MKALTYALALLAALRATRFVVNDSLGDWTIVRPVKRWAHLRETPRPRTPSPFEPVPEDYVSFADIVEYTDPDPANGWRSKLAKGLECPFCVGFWITGAAVLAAAFANCGPRRRAAFQVAAGAFGANYLTGHISKRLD